MCYFPKLIRNPKYTPNKKNGGVLDYAKMLSPKFDKRVMGVPIGCGQCIACRKKKAREWQVRLLEDVRHNKNGTFVTLTFSNEWIKKISEEITWNETKKVIGEKHYINKHGELKKRYIYKKVRTKQIKYRGYDTDNAIATYAVRKFNERWRKKYGKAVRHWLVTELGHKGTENIHLHGFIWAEDTTKLRELWKYGYVWDGYKKGNKRENYVNERTVNYCMKYMSKMDFQHMGYKPKILTSAGIGAGYFYRTDWYMNRYRKGQTNEAYTTRNGRKMSLPIYLRNKIYTDDQREKLWIEKLDKQERWVEGQRIDIKYGMENWYKAIEDARRKNERLGYGTGTVDWDKKRYEEERRQLLFEERIATQEEYPDWILYGTVAEKYDEELGF